MVAPAPRVRTRTLAGSGTSMGCDRVVPLGGMSAAVVSPVADVVGSSSGSAGSSPAPVLPLTRGTAAAVVGWLLPLALLEPVVPPADPEPAAEPLLPNVGVVLSPVLSVPVLMVPVLLPVLLAPVLVAPVFEGVLVLVAAFVLPEVPLFVVEAGAFAVVLGVALLVVALPVVALLVVALPVVLAVLLTGVAADAVVAVVPLLPVFAVFVVVAVVDVVAVFEVAAGAAVARL
jgi:hypothetical protein